MLRTVIIDDELPAIEMLKALTARYPELVKVIGSASVPEKGIELIEDYKPDLVFLDISMPGLDGFELLDKLRYKEFTLVFTTAHREYAIRAIRNKAFDYLLKPIDTGELEQCLRNVAQQYKSTAPASGTQSGLLEVLVKDGIIYIKPKEIVRLEASGSYTVFYMDDGSKLMASKNLKEFEARLDPASFYRCHNSHLINLHKVKKFVNHDGFFALMSDGSMADVSKNHKDTFLERLKNL